MTLDKLSRLRIYWKNGGKIKEELCCQKKEEKKKEEELCFRAQEMMVWERQNRKDYGKYVDRLQASIKGQTAMKVYFQKMISEICG